MQCVWCIYHLNPPWKTSLPSQFWTQPNQHDLTLVASSHGKKLDWATSKKAGAHEVNKHTLPGNSGDHFGVVKTWWNGCSWPPTGWWSQVTLNHLVEQKTSWWFKVTFWSPKGRSPNSWKRSLETTKKGHDRKNLDSPSPPVFLLPRHRSSTAEALNSLSEQCRRKGRCVFLILCSVVHHRMQ